ncbi:hypothetical protein ACFTAO_20580 [Paenibacillus rhizoplanae]
MGSGVAEAAGDGVAGASVAAGVCAAAGEADTAAGAEPVVLPCAEFPFPSQPLARSRQAEAASRRRERRGGTYFYFFGG